MINGAIGRRRWSGDERARILEETLAPGAVVSAVARRHGLTRQQLFTWRREARKAAETLPAFVPAVIALPAVAAPESGSRGIIPVIPHKTNEKNKRGFFAKALYRGRAHIEQAVGKLKRFKWVALRCEKTRRNFASIVALAAAFILVKSVHTA